MFTQAEFNPRRSFVCYGFIMRRGWTWFRASRMVRFASGEYAWDGGHGRITWPEQVTFIGNVSAIRPDLTGLSLDSSRLP